MHVSCTRPPSFVHCLVTACCWGWNYKATLLPLFFDSWMHGPCLWPLVNSLMLGPFSFVSCWSCSELGTLFLACMVSFKFGGRELSMHACLCILVQSFIVYACPAWGVRLLIGWFLSPSSVDACGSFPRGGFPLGSLALQSWWLLSLSVCFCCFWLLVLLLGVLFSLRVQEEIECFSLRLLVG